MNWLFQAQWRQQNIDFTWQWWSCTWSWSSTSECAHAAEIITLHSDRSQLQSASHGMKRTLNTLELLLIHVKKKRSSDTSSELFSCTAAKENRLCKLCEFQVKAQENWLNWTAVGAFFSCLLVELVGWVLRGILTCLWPPVLWKMNEYNSTDRAAGGQFSVRCGLHFTSTFRRNAAAHLAIKSSCWCQSSVTAH